MDDRTRIDVGYVANLARLELNESDRERLQRDMESIVAYIAELSEVDIDGVEPTALLRRTFSGRSGGSTKPRRGVPATSVDSAGTAAALLRCSSITCPDGGTEASQGRTGVECGKGRRAEPVPDRPEWKRPRFVSRVFRGEKKRFFRSGLQDFCLERYRKRYFPLHFAGLPASKEEGPYGFFR